MAPNRDRPPPQSSCASSALGNQTDEDKPNPNGKGNHGTPGSTQPSGATQTLTNQEEPGTVAPFEIFGLAGVFKAALVDLLSPPTFKSPLLLVPVAVNVGAPLVLHVLLRTSPSSSSKSLTFLAGCSLVVAFLIAFDRACKLLATLIEN
ncbi:hypothetical protein KEM48_000655 [Puccinia striiformis f. sp. tritici PST-130]|nr:hypothetical protein KEM48_000655 [Puccinia striiformis f. sp. tritici PST-130]